MRGLAAVGASRWRRAWVQVHLWLGLTLGVIGTLIGLSGSVLVYDHEIDEALNPQRYSITAIHYALPFDEYARRAAKALGEGVRPAGIRLPDFDDGPIIVFARAVNGPFQRAYLDPGTGRVLDTATGQDWLGFLHAFHESLTLRDYNGREMVGVVGVAMLISSLSGLYLWWPARGARASFAFRRGRTLSRNLHYTFGFWSMVVLAVLSFTGAMYRRRRAACARPRPAARRWVRTKRSPSHSTASPMRRSWASACPWVRAARIASTCAK